MKLVLLFMVAFSAVIAQSDCNKVGFIHGADGYCYKFVTNLTIFFDAAKDCAKTGSRLATIANPDQSRLVAELAPISAAAYPYFIGYTTGGPLNNWTFDNPTATPDQDNYHPWAVKPTCHGFKCEPQAGDVAVFNKDGSWDKLYPEKHHIYSYICQYMNNNVGVCASNSVAPFPFQPLQYTNKCYSIIDNVKQNQAYSENQCKKFGGHLAKIQSQFENDFLLQKFCWECIDTENDGGLEQAFIGLYVAQDGSYMWTDGTKLQKGDYTNFQSQPGYGKCVVINFPTGKWSYADCNNFAAYSFCNRAMTTTN